MSLFLVPNNWTSATHPRADHHKHNFMIFCRIPIKKANECAYPYTISTKDLNSCLKKLLGTKMKFIYIFAKICQNNDREAHFLHIKSCSINCRCESTLAVFPNFFQIKPGGFQLHFLICIYQFLAIFATEDVVRLLFFFGLNWSIHWIYWNQRHKTEY